MRTLSLTLITLAMAVGCAGEVAPSEGALGAFETENLDSTLYFVPGTDTGPLTRAEVGADFARATPITVDLVGTSRGDWLVAWELGDVHAGVPAFAIAAWPVVEDVTPIADDVRPEDPEDAPSVNPPGVAPPLAPVSPVSARPTRPCRS